MHRRWIQRSSLLRRSVVGKVLVPLHLVARHLIPQSPAGVERALDALHATAQPAAELVHVPQIFFLSISLQKKAFRNRHRSNIAVVRTIGRGVHSIIIKKTVRDRSRLDTHENLQSGLIATAVRRHAHAFDFFQPLLLFRGFPLVGLYSFLPFEILMLNLGRKLGPPLPQLFLGIAFE